MESLFRCPVCGAPLDRGDRAYRCPAGHSYDIHAVLQGQGGKGVTRVVEPHLG